MSSLMRSLAAAPVAAAFVLMFIATTTYRTGFSEELEATVFLGFDGRAEHTAFVTLDGLPELPEDQVMIELEVEVLGLDTEYVTIDGPGRSGGSPSMGVDFDLDEAGCLAGGSCSLAKDLVFEGATGESLDVVLRVEIVHTKDTTLDLSGVTASLDLY